MTDEPPWTQHRHQLLRDIAADRITLHYAVEGWEPRRRARFGARRPLPYWLDTALRDFRAEYCGFLDIVARREYSRRPRQVVLTDDGTALLDRWNSEHPNPEESRR